MKRVGNIYEKITSKDNLLSAYINAKRGKSKYQEVIDFEENMEDNLDKLQEALVNEKFVNSPYETFRRMCGGKEREIFKLPFFPDRICQWAIMLQVEKYFIRNFTKDTYSAIPKRGIHQAVKRIKKIIRNDANSTQYYLKLDVKKYYPNIDHEILKHKLNCIFKDKKLLGLFDVIIDSMPNGKGVPIGNYTSQYFGNFYLSSLDHFVKENKQVKYYFRYMDDMVIFSSNKQDLHAIKRDIVDYLEVNLKLSTNKKEQIRLLNKQPLDFIGYVFHHNKTMLRKRIKKNFARNFRAKSTPSYYGWISHCDGKSLFNKLLKTTGGHLK